MQQSDSETTPETVTQQPEAANMETGVIAEQILSGNEGDIHYSYYLPENYDENKAYPLMMTMPGYDRMWFGEDSSGFSGMDRTAGGYDCRFCATDGLA